MSKYNVVFFNVTDNTGRNANLPVGMGTPIGTAYLRDGRIDLSSTDGKTTMYDIIGTFVNPITIQHGGYTDLSGGKTGFTLGSDTVSKYHFGIQGNNDFTLIAESNSEFVSLDNSKLQGREIQDESDDLMRMLAWVYFNQNKFADTDTTVELSPNISKYSSVGEELLLEYINADYLNARLKNVIGFEFTVENKLKFIDFTFNFSIDGNVRQHQIRAIFDTEFLRTNYRQDETDVYTYIDEQTGVIPSEIDDDEMERIVKKVADIQRTGKWNNVIRKEYTYVKDDGDRIKQLFFIFTNQETLFEETLRRACGSIIEYHYPLTGVHSLDWRKYHWPEVFLNYIVYILPFYSNTREMEVDSVTKSVTTPIVTFSDFENFLLENNIADTGTYNVELIPPANYWKTSTDGLINYPLVVYEPKSLAQTNDNYPFSRIYKKYDPAIEVINTGTSTSPSFPQNDRTMQIIWKLLYILKMADNNILVGEGKYDQYVDTDGLIQSGSIAEYLQLGVEIVSDNEWYVVFRDQSVTFHVLANSQKPTRIPS